MDRTDILLEKLACISDTGVQLLTQDEIKDAATHRSPFVRSGVCEALVAYPKDFSKKLLLILIKDKNPSVRSDAAIQLYDGVEDEALIDVLWEAFLNDTDALTRGYSGAALIKFCYHDKNAAIKINNALLKERNMFVRAICNGEIYMQFGEKFALMELINCYHSKIYQTRCAVCNILADVLKKEDVSIIEKLIPKWQKSETTIAVLSSIETLKKKLDAYFLE